MSIHLNVRVSWLGKVTISAAWLVMRMVNVSCPPNVHIQSTTKNINRNADKMESNANPCTVLHTHHPCIGTNMSLYWFGFFSRIFPCSPKNECRQLALALLLYRYYTNNHEHHKHKAHTVIGLVWKNFFDPTTAIVHVLTCWALGGKKESESPRKKYTQCTDSNNATTTTAAADSAIAFLFATTKFPENFNISNKIECVISPNMIK